MAFRTLSWMNSSFGVKTKETEEEKLYPIDNLNLVRESLLNLPSWKKSTSHKLDDEDTKKAIAIIMDELLVDMSLYKKYYAIRTLADNLPGSFSEVISILLSKLCEM